MRRLLKMTLFLMAGYALLFQHANGQEAVENPIRLSGLVFDVDSLYPLPGTHYFKISQGTGGITNEEGRFQTSVRVNDSIIFSFVGYKNHLLLISDSLAPGEYVMGIPLSRDTTMINEVMILPRFKNLKQDFLATPASSDIALQNAKQNLRVATAQGVAGKGIPFDADMSYEMHKQKLENRAMSRGMIGSDQMVSVNFLLVIPYVIYKLSEKNKESTPKNIYISSKEIQEIYNSYRKSIYKTKKPPE